MMVRGFIFSVEDFPEFFETATDWGWSYGVKRRRRGRTRRKRNGIRRNRGNGVISFSGGGSGGVVFDDLDRDVVGGSAEGARVLLQKRHAEEAGGHAGAGRHFGAGADAG